MSIKFGTDEWIKAACQECKKSQDYKEAAKDWEGDMYFVIEPGDLFPEKVYLYMDLWHGECRSAHIITDPKEKSPAYKMIATYEIWKEILDGKLDFVKAMIVGKITVEGDMAQVVKKSRASVEMTNCMRRIDTEFPE